MWHCQKSVTAKSTHKGEREFSPQCTPGLLRLTYLPTERPCSLDWGLLSSQMSPMSCTKWGPTLQTACTSAFERSLHLLLPPTEFLVSSPGQKKLTSTNPSHDQSDSVQRSFVPRGLWYWGVTVLVTSGLWWRGKVNKRRPFYVWRVRSLGKEEESCSGKHQRQAHHLLVILKNTFWYHVPNVIFETNQTPKTERVPFFSLISPANSVT